MMKWKVKSILMVAVVCFLFSLSNVTVFGEDGCVTVNGDGILLEGQSRCVSRQWGEQTQTQVLKCQKKEDGTYELVGVDACGAGNNTKCYDDPATNTAQCRGPDFATCTSVSTYSDGKTMKRWNDQTGCIDDHTIGKCDGYTGTFIAQQNCDSTQYCYSWVSGWTGSGWGTCEKSLCKDDYSGVQANQNEQKCLGTVRYGTCDKGSFTNIHDCASGEPCREGKDGIPSCVKEIVCTTFNGEKLSIDSDVGEKICSNQNQVLECTDASKPNYNLYKTCGTTERCVMTQTDATCEVLGSGETVPGEITPPPTQSQENPTDIFCSGSTDKINTALGCIPVTVNGFIAWLLPILFGIAGGISFLLMVYGFILVATSSGDEKKLQGAKETITSAITGLLLSIFAIFLFRLIAVNILKIPGIN